MTPEEKETLIAEIQKLKEATQKETGAFKYDFAYDEVVELINHRPTCDDAT